MTISFPLETPCSKCRNRTYNSMMRGGLPVHYCSENHQMDWANDNCPDIDIWIHDAAPTEDI